MAKKSGGPFDQFFGARKGAVAAYWSLKERRVVIEVRMTAAHRRMEELRAFHEQRRAEIAAMLAARIGGKPPTPKPRRDRKPPREDGGEPIPAIPRPKPKPLAGGAAAPLDPDRRKLGGIRPRTGAPGRVPSDAESRQSP